MGLNEFASYYPEDFNMLSENVRYIIGKNNMTGKESLESLDHMVDEIVSNFDENCYHNRCEQQAVQYQQMSFEDFRHIDRGGGRGRDRRRGHDWYRGPDWGRGHDRHRGHDFDIRDITRLIFLRELFDRRHHRHH